MAKKKEQQKILRITLVKSPIGYTKRQKATVRALGLRRLHQTITHEDKPQIRGMVNSIIHLLSVKEETV
jgi:large subunit ribosomal protein L30